jgi:hypothetical protein
MTEEESQVGGASGESMGESRWESNESMHRVYASSLCIECIPIHVIPFQIVLHSRMLIQPRLSCLVLR